MKRRGRSERGTYEMLRNVNGATKQRNRLKKNTLGCLLKMKGITTTDAYIDMVSLV